MRSQVVVPDSVADIPYVVELAATLCTLVPTTRGGEIIERHVDPALLRESRCYGKFVRCICTPLDWYLSRRHVDASWDCSSFFKKIEPLFA